MRINVLRSGLTKCMFSIRITVMSHEHVLIMIIFPVLPEENSCLKEAEK